MEQFPKIPKEIVTIFPENPVFTLKSSDTPLKFETKLAISNNLKYKYFVFHLKTTGKDRYSVDGGFSFLCPEEKKEIIISRLSMDKCPYKRVKEKFQILLYDFNDKINDEIEANNAFDLKLYKKTPIKEIKFITIQNNNKELYIEFISKSSTQELEYYIQDNENIFTENIENKIIFKENEIISQDSLFLYKTNYEYFSYLSIITIFNETNNYIIYKIYLNNTDLFNFKNKNCFIAPNDKNKIIIQRKENSSSQKIQEKILFIFYTVNGVINNKKEAINTFKKLDSNHLPSKREKILPIILKENTDDLYISNNENEIDLKKNNISIKNDNNNASINPIEEKIFELNDNLKKEEKENIKEEKTIKPENKNYSNDEKKHEDNKNNILIERINELEKELRKEKENNIKLNDIIKKYKEEEKAKINWKSQIESLKQKLFEKDNEIDELKTKLSRFPFELNEREKIICVNFNVNDESIKNYSIICKNTHIFKIIENKFYEDFPEFFNSDNNFLVEGIKIDKNKSLEENNIHHNDVIIINFLDI